MANKEDYVNGIFTKIDANMSRNQLTQRFSKMMGNVMSMIQTNGPIYHTWIKFQFGKKDKAVIFNTDTQNINQNLIASLDVEKTGANTCNSFTLQVVFDPFNHGQETKNQIEYLDECIADAQSYNLDEDTDSLRGYIQYGYSNPGSDLELMSPRYEFIMTDFESKVKASSGITNWTFKGVCALGADCEYKTNIGTYDANWKIKDIIIWTLFENYGDNNHKPEGQTGTAKENEFKYRFDIDKSILEDTVTLGEYDGESASLQATDTNPLKFVEGIMQKYPYLKSEKDSGKYDDTTGLKYTQIPRYDWFLTETDGVKTFHLTHYTPSEKGSNNKAEEYWITCPGSEVGLTWGTQNRNIVIDWNPQVDTKLYIIRKAIYKRILEKIKSGTDLDFDALATDDEEFREELKEAFKTDTMGMEKALMNELYDAEITLVGIPADAPIGAYIKIIPRILESVSRTAGTYMVKGSSDHITTGGVYTTTLQLFRKDDLDESWESLQQKIAEKSAEKTNTTE